MIDSTRVVAKLPDLFNKVRWILTMFGQLSGVEFYQDSSDPALCQSFSQTQKGESFRPLNVHFQEIHCSESRVVQDGIQRAGGNLIQETICMTLPNHARQAEITALFIKPSKRHRAG